MHACACHYMAILTGGPGGPGSPRKPFGPRSPSSPMVPRDPFSPSGPTSPCGPRMPSTPFGPCVNEKSIGFLKFLIMIPFTSGPCRPCGPWFPFGPVSPTIPAGPCRPESPFSPRIPFSPFSPSSPFWPCDPAPPCPWATLAVKCHSIMTVMYSLLRHCLHAVLQGQDLPAFPWVPHFPRHHLPQELQVDPIHYGIVYFKVMYSVVCLHSQVVQTFLEFPDGLVDLPYPSFHPCQDHPLHPLAPVCLALLLHLSAHVDPLVRVYLSCPFLLSLHWSLFVLWLHLALHLLSLPSILQVLVFPVNISQRKSITIMSYIYTRCMYYSQSDYSNMHTYTLSLCPLWSL